MQISENSVKKSRGILMFVILLLAYIVFASNWVAGSNLSKEIVSYYFNGESVSPVLSEVINYTITIARIFANLLAAYILLKLNPRRASIIALVLLCFSIAAVFSANYWLYTAARMIMALGGSMIMVYMNTVVARFIADDEKIIANALVTASYNIGAALVAVVFFFCKDAVFADWQHTMFIFSSSSVLFLVLWILLAKDFSPSGGKEQSQSSSGSPEEYGYKDALADKFVYRFSLGFGGFLFLYVMSLVSLPVKLAEQAGSIFNSEFMILAITAGGIGGTLFSMLISKIYFRRKPFLMIHGVLMISAMAFGLYMSSVNPNAAYLSFAAGGFIMFSQYSVYLNFPHELPNMNPRRLTIMFGIFWALGYSVYTALNFLWSVILSLYGWDCSAVFYIACSCMYLVFVSTFPKTKKELPE